MGEGQQLPGCGKLLKNESVVSPRDSRRQISFSFLNDKIIITSSLSLFLVGTREFRLRRAAAAGTQPSVLTAELNVLTAMLKTRDSLPSDDK
jgi:hypothetical protein